MFTICGSGFGLYGYLPALIALNEDVILPVAYKEKIQHRSELSSFSESISWVSSLDDALSEASSVILASPPHQQISLTERCLSQKNIERVIIEKPMAIAPADAINLLARLESSGKRFEVAYTLLYTSWFESLRWGNNTDDLFQIHWSFMADHFINNKKNWKRQHTHGGGVLRFYGIHLLALLAYLGYEKVCSSSIQGKIIEEPDKWTAEFSGRNLPLCKVIVDSHNSRQVFSINSTKKNNIVNLSDPFEKEQTALQHDKRVNSLKRLLQSLYLETATLNTVYKRTNSLWLQIEEILAGK
tara:strand:- start:1306 stop:2202 length:897 start_codon:yes stop_codon:yes gene_type:complete